MALRRRSSGSHHRPDWEQRLCRVDAALADDALAPPLEGERYRAPRREEADDLPGGRRADDADDADHGRTGEPPAAP